MIERIIIVVESAIWKSDYEIQCGGYSKRQKYMWLNIQLYLGHVFNEFYISL